MIVDSSVWIEILRQGKLSSKCQKAFTNEIVRIPTLVLFEVYRKMKSLATEEIALETVASLSQYEILDLNREVAVLAADLSLKHQLAMADSMVLAHAVHLSESLLTLDNDFAEIPEATLIRS